MAIAIVGIWKDDISRTPQLYEFSSWGEALEFYKKDRKYFELMYHCTIPDEPKRA